MTLHNPNNSIDQLLQIFKFYRTENSEQRKACSPHFLDQFESTKTQTDSCLSDQFSFSKDLTNISYGMHSSLQKKQHKDRESLLSARRSQQSNQTYNSNIFTRLYQENKTIREKRQKLFQEGRQSLEKIQTKQCTFSPNVKHSKHRTEHSCNHADIEAFYQKNMEWQTRKETSIKKKQCDKNNSETTKFTFAPKINPYKKKIKQNKQNLQYTSTKKKTDSYLQTYHRSNKELGQTTAKLQNKGTLNLRKGYFSYVT